MFGNKIIWPKLITLKSAIIQLPLQQKLKQFYKIKQYNLKNAIETNDSVYVNVLIKIGDFENYLNNNNYDQQFKYTVNVFKNKYSDLKIKDQKYLATR